MLALIPTKFMELLGTLKGKWNLWWAGMEKYWTVDIPRWWKVDMPLWWQQMIDSIRLKFNVWKGEQVKYWTIDVPRWWREDMPRWWGESLASIKVRFDAWWSGFRRYWTEDIPRWWKEDMPRWWSEGFSRIGKSFNTWISDNFGVSVDDMKERFKSIFKVETWKGWATSAFNAIRSPFNSIVGGLNKSIIKGINTFAKTVGIKKDGKWISDIPELAMARGGILDGYTPVSQGDDRLVHMRSGEGVIVSEALRNNPYEVKRLHALNKAALGGKMDKFYEGYASGGIVGGGLSAWQASVRNVASILAKTFNVPVPNSSPSGRPQASRYGYVSDHPRGMAFDVMFKKLHDPLGYAINSWLHKNASALALKYTIWDRYSYPLRLGGKRGSRLNRGDPTNNHEDHVHASFKDQVASLRGISGRGGGVGGIINGALDILGGPLNALKKKLDSFNLSPLRDSGMFGGWIPPFIKPTFTKLIEGAGQSILSKIGIGGATATNEADFVGSSGGSANIRAIVQGLAAKRGWGSGTEWNALTWLINKESSWNPNAQNPTSTAYGLFQFLNSTWSGTGIRKTSDPTLQTMAGLKYIAQRYGTPSKAAAFHRSHNWYSKGGIIEPLLRDSGGPIPQGTSIIQNNTGKTEWAFSNDQVQKLIGLVDQLRFNMPSSINGLKGTVSIANSGNVYNDIKIEVVARAGEDTEAIANRVVDKIRGAQSNNVRGMSGFQRVSNRAS